MAYPLLSGLFLVLLVIVELPIAGLGSVDESVLPYLAASVSLLSVDSVVEDHDVMAAAAFQVACRAIWSR